MRTRSDIKPLGSGIALESILASLNLPSCAEREAEVTATRLTRWADAMAAQGYRHSVKSLEALRLYLAGYGLIIMGGVGTGKTCFFRALARAIARNGVQETARLAVWPMIGVAGRRLDGIRAELEDMADSEIVVDDIGAEPTFNEFGNKWDLLPWVIEMRMASPARTHFTTNLLPAELERRYGSRTVDRLHEMAASVTLDGKSNRRTMPNSAAVMAYERAVRDAAMRKDNIPCGAQGAENKKENAR